MTLSNVNGRVTPQRAGVRSVHFVLPDGVDDPRRPSGGNVYDRRLARALAATGWSVREHALGSQRPLGDVLAALPDGGLVLVDGLVTRGASDAVARHADRLLVVVLMHEPVGPGTDGRAGERADERAVLASAAAVVTPSRWTAGQVADLHGLDSRRLHVATPGVDPAYPHAGTAAGGRLLCVGAIRSAKGQHVLVEALATLRDRPWSGRVVGSPDVDPAYARAVERRARTLRISDRLAWTGPLAGDSLTAAYASADLLVVPSAAETYGMVVTEALAHGVPVVASAVGGVPEALGRTPSGARPGLLVAPADPLALARALRAWLSDAELRKRLRRRARERATTLAGWDTTADAVSTVLGAVRRHAAVVS